jgi:hypothetical protein
MRAHSAAMLTLDLSVCLSATLNSSFDALLARYLTVNITVLNRPSVRSH